MRTFDIDHRENDKLHRLYVRYALEELKIINEFVNDMRDLSRATSSIISSEVMRAAREETMRNAAWFEAAALLFSEADVSGYFTED